jgi:hypothetical protein
MVTDPVSLHGDGNEYASRGKIMAKLNCRKFKQCGGSWEVNGMLRVCLNPYQGLVLVLPDS